MRIVTISRKPCEGSTTGNVRLHEAGALNIDGTRIAGPAWTRSTETIEDMRGGRYGTASKDRIPTGPREMPEGGRWPANVLLEGPEAAMTLDAQSGTSTSGPLKPVDATNWKSKPFDDGRGWNQHAMHGTGQIAPQGYGDTGGASRYFKQVKP